MNKNVKSLIVEVLSCHDEELVRIICESFNLHDVDKLLSLLVNNPEVDMEKVSNARYLLNINKRANMNSASVSYHLKSEPAYFDNKSTVTNGLRDCGVEFNNISDMDFFNTNSMHNKSKSCIINE
jgi:hypothetical protein